SGPGFKRTQALLVLRAGNALPTSRGNPRNGGPGADSPCQGEMARRARGGRERRHWRTEFASAASPGDPQGELPRRGKRGWPGPLVSFPSLGKKLAPQGETLRRPQ